jgi:hypothetical protein
MGNTRERAQGSITDPTAQRVHRASSRPWLDRWMAILRTVGNIQAWILLTLFYVVIITPFGLIYRFVANPLRLRWRESNWQSLPRQYDRMDQALEQS